MYPSIMHDFVELVVMPRKRKAPEDENGDGNEESDLAIEDNDIMERIRPRRDLKKRDVLPEPVKPKDKDAKPGKRGRKPGSTNLEKKVKGKRGRKPRIKEDSKEEKENGSADSESATSEDTQDVADSELGEGELGEGETDGDSVDEKSTETKEETEAPSSSLEKEDPKKKEKKVKKVRQQKLPPPRPKNREGKEGDEETEEEPKIRSERTREYHEWRANPVIQVLRRALYGPNRYRFLVSRRENPAQLEWVAQQKMMWTNRVKFREFMKKCGDNDNFTDEDAREEHDRLYPKENDDVYELKKRIKEKVVRKPKEPKPPKPPKIPTMSMPRPMMGPGPSGMHGGYMPSSIPDVYGHHRPDVGGYGDPSRMGMVPSMAPRYPHPQQQQQQQHQQQQQQMHQQHPQMPMHPPLPLSPPPMRPHPHHQTHMQLGNNHMGGHPHQQQQQLPPQGLQQQGHMQPVHHQSPPGHHQGPYMVPPPMTMAEPVLPGMGPSPSHSDMMYYHQTSEAIMSGGYPPQGHYAQPQPQPPPPPQIPVYDPYAPVHSHYPV